MSANRECRHFRRGVLRAHSDDPATAFAVGQQSGFTNHIAAQGGRNGQEHIGTWANTKTTWFRILLPRSQHSGHGAGDFQRLAVAGYCIARSTRVCFAKVDATRRKRASQGGREKLIRCVVGEHNHGVLELDGVLTTERSCSSTSQGFREGED
jgi:hypothetical protein